MGDEQALLNAVLTAPEDDQLRQVYADWLEEQGDPRGEFLRLDASLPVLSRRKRYAARDRLRELYAVINEDWLALICRAEIDRCPPSHSHPPCPKRWGRLERTEDPFIRTCGSCGKQVFYCDTLALAQRHAKRGHIIVLAPCITQKPGDISFSYGYYRHPPKEYLPGQRVTIRAGRLKGQVGEITQVDLSKLRVAVRLEAGGPPPVIEVDIDEVVRLR
ncbi:MAG: TIGR02996 domain-containing protein [Gemmataceae bacterium]|nr:TIGR02996 domain-containing protein [Gemmataceae bacterium]